MGYGLILSGPLNYGPHENLAHLDILLEKVVGPVVKRPYLFLHPWKNSFGKLSFQYFILLISSVDSNGELKAILMIQIMLTFISET